MVSLERFDGIDEQIKVQLKSTGTGGSMTADIRKCQDFHTAQITRGHSWIKDSGDDSHEAHK